jgi:hypothetical protein
MTTTHTTQDDHYTLKLKTMKNDKDNYLLPHCRQDTKKGKGVKK